MRYERPIFIAGILPSCSSLYPVLVLIRRASHICSMFITSGYLRSITRYAACGVSSIAEVGGSGRAVQPLRQSANAVCRFISDTPKRMFSAFQTE